ncbi:EF hand [Phytophthora infestans]|uniref:EF hand n=1 Tax=Phytophthora infestans TaxID=4787 RepID=A0A833X254_PHYIN|nr:EF hand [Phytophthora infestans]
MLDLKRSRFSEKAFSVMDRNGSGEVDFIEFVLAVWNYCTFNHASLIRFAFDLYDVDGSGEIEHDEVVRCVREVWGSSWETSPNAHKIVEKLDAIMENTANNRLSANLFQEFAVRHPMLLFPAFELQMEIQRKVLGKRFWSRAAEKRGSINVAALNWDHVKEVTLISRKTSSKLLTSMEEDLGSQLQTKPASNWYGRGSGFRPFAHRSRRTLVSNTNSKDESNETPDDGSIKLPELKRTMTPAKREIRRQSAPAATTRRTSNAMDAKSVKAASPKHISQDLVRQTNIPGSVS